MRKTYTQKITLPTKPAYCTSLIIALLICLSSYCQDSALTIPLWQNGAPGFENRKNIPEEAKEWWVKYVNNLFLLLARL